MKVYRHVIAYLIIIAIIIPTTIVFSYSSLNLRFSLNNSIFADFSSLEPGLEGYSNASSYVPGDSPHPTILLREGDPNVKCGMSESLPVGWWPDSSEEVELVILIGDPEVIHLEHCEYTMGGTYDRFQTRRNVSLVKAKTGEIIKNTTLYGPIPSECPETKEAGTHIDENGGDISSEQIINYVADHVNTTRDYSPNDQFIGSVAGVIAGSLFFGFLWAIFVKVKIEVEKQDNDVYAKKCIRYGALSMGLCNLAFIPFIGFLIGALTIISGIMAIKFNKKSKTGAIYQKMGKAFGIAGILLSLFILGLGQLVIISSFF